MILLCMMRKLKKVLRVTLMSQNVLRVKVITEPKIFGFHHLKQNMMGMFSTIFIITKRSNPRESVFLI